MPINITDELHAATTKGKIASAKEVFLTGDTENLQQIGEKTHQLEDSIKNIAATGGASTAAAVTFDNAASGMAAVTAQAAIEELNTKNKVQGNELSKKANSTDVTSQIQTERERVNAELEKKFAKVDIVQELGDNEDKVVSQKCVKEVADVADLKIKNLNITMYDVNDKLDEDYYNKVEVQKGYILYTPTENNRKFKEVNILAANNVFDISSLVRGKRLDDSGNIVDDKASGYIDTFIPVAEGMWLLSNKVTITQDIYFYDKYKRFIKRVHSSVPVTGRGIEIPNGVFYVKFQVALSSFDSATENSIILHDGSKIPVFGTFSKFRLNTDAKLYNNEPNFIWTDDFSSFTYKESKKETGRTIKRENLFTDMSLWEPDSVDEGYSNPSSGYGQDTKREDWAAEDKYKYYEFLEHYYDIYLGESNGYKVKRQSLCQDTAHTGYEIFEYDFCPKNYKYVVMLSAGMNADETQGIWGLATFIRCLVNEEEPMLAIAKKNIRFKVIPIINASGFDEDTLRYNYANGVNPNYNFNYKDAWSKQTKTGKGEYPDSNIETQALKKWMNDNAGIACWYQDIHTGRWNNGANVMIMDLRFPSKEVYGNLNDTIAVDLNKYYKNKGWVAEDISKYYTGYAQTLSPTVYDYSKHFYAWHVCGIPNCMSEMHIESTGYGADGYTNNTALGIKSYVLQIRILMMFFVNKWISEHSQISLQDPLESRAQQLYK